MATLALTEDGDLDFSTGKLVIERDPAKCLASKLRARYRLYLGEWLLDTRLGVPYVQLILVKNPNMTVVRGVLRRVLESTPGVASIDEFTVTYDPRTRSAAFSFRVTTDLGAVITGGSGEPFIVETST